MKLASLLVPVLLAALPCPVLAENAYIDSRGRRVALVTAPGQTLLPPRAGVVFLDPESGRPFELDRAVIVKLVQGAESLPHRLLVGTGLVPVRSLSADGSTVLCQARDTAQALDGSRIASGLPGVRWAIPNFGFPLELHYVPDDPYYPQQWYLDQDGDHHIHAEEAWDVTKGSSDVIVAVVDTGVQADHPDLAGSTIVTGIDVVDGDNDPLPGTSCSSAHGTCCAGLIAASMDNGQGIAGICPQCSLMGVRLNKPGGFTTYAQVIDSYNYARDHGAAVISNSWGFPTGDAPDLSPLLDTFNDVVTSGRGGLGVVVLFSAGNDGIAIAPGDFAALPQVMAIGGTDHQDAWVTYADYGEYLSVVAPTGIAVTATPPQHQILTTDTFGGTGGYSRGGSFWSPNAYGADINFGWPEVDATGDYTQYFNGTSAACPIAAGVVALVLSANPALTGAQARFVVEQTADKVGGVAYDEHGRHEKYGHGRINAGRAARAAEIGFASPEGGLCAEDFNCTNGDCRKPAPAELYGICAPHVDCGAASEGSACNDDDPCTEDERCTGGSCVGAPRSCADGDPCTVDSCDSASGRCVFAPKVCDDANPCTNDSCGAATGECGFAPTQLACDDADPCTLADACSGGACAGTPIDCSTLAGTCHEGACNTATGQCEARATADGTACDDGDACTQADRCQGGLCVPGTDTCRTDSGCGCATTTGGTVPWLAMAIAALLVGRRRSRSST